MSYLSKEIIGDTFLNVSVIAIKTKKEQLLGKCRSIHNRFILGQILPAQHFNLYSRRLDLSREDGVFLPLNVTCCGFRLITVSLTG